MFLIEIIYKYTYGYRKANTEVLLKFPVQDEVCLYFLKKLEKDLTTSLFCLKY